MSDNSTAWKTLAAIGGVASALWGLYSFVSDSGSSGKTMKAPGKDDRIFRDAFESNPAGYFRDLRAKK